MGISTRGACNEEERRLMIEKGMTPPPLGNLVNSERAAGSREVVESSLRNGIILVFVVLGLLAAFAMLRYVVGTDGTLIPDRIAALLGPAGALVTLIGVGHLVYFRIARGRDAARGL
ncbi:MAG: DUF6249 domain-containing protein [Steroidobacteraceae bacterium]